MALHLQKIIGHRGLGGLYPENTLTSVLEAKRTGLNWVEVDVKLSSDKHPVVFHDDTLDRTTDGSGLLADSSLAELKLLDAGRFNGLEFENERIPTLVELLDLCLAIKMNLNIELKPNPGQDEETAEQVIRIIKNHDFLYKQQILFSSYSVPALSVCKRHAPLIPRGLLARDDHEISDQTHTELEVLDCFSLHMMADHLSQDVLASCQEKGYRVLVHTVNEISKAQQLWDSGVTAVFSDFPIHLKA